MTVTLPGTLVYGYVTGRFLLAVGDTPADPDSLPDARAAVGSVTFTAATPLTKEYAADPPVTVVRSVITCTIDSEGYLLDPAGNRGVWLVTGVYKVAYNLNTGAITGHDILVLPEHTVESPMDLINYMPPGGPVLTASQYAELAARMEVLETEVVYGASAYSLAVEQGYSGTLEQWLESLNGTDGQDSTVPGPSAYQIAVAEGFTGTPTEWLESLKGSDALTSAWEFVSNTVFSSTVVEVNIAIPANTKALRVSLFGIYGPNAGAGGANLYLVVNGDTGNNYMSALIGGALPTRALISTAMPGAQSGMRNSGISVVTLYLDGLNVPLQFIAHSGSVASRWVSSGSTNAQNSDIRAGGWIGAGPATTLKFFLVHESQSMGSGLRVLVERLPA